MTEQTLSPLTPTPSVAPNTQASGVFSVSPKPPEISSEADFHRVMRTVEVEKKSFNSQITDALAQEVHSALKQQNSDKALTLITFGALSLRSSDIHYDMTETDTRIRMRIDGNLAEIFALSRAEYKLVLERLKYKADLKLNITHIPQDGKYRIDEGGKRVDVRISTLPVKFGENVVCRVLDSTQNIPNVGDLGFMWTSKREIERAMNKKSGMILVTGPTGSGKTTTLYSMMQDLNTSDRKIITLEDPVEYELPGVVQSEVNEKNGYTYQSGLKALLRQDPDVIMVGEIRDYDTANIAVQASLTGHIVLSTLHTKSAAETLERLLNMGVAPYVLASSIDIILAQRLVRKVCPHCAQKYPANPQENEMIKWMMRDIGIDAVAKKKVEGFDLWRGAGCDACGHTGYKGRVGVFEVLAFSEELKVLVRGGASPSEILAHARSHDFITMREDGILKAMRGKTTLEELFSVID